MNTRKSTSTRAGRISGTRTNKSNTPKSDPVEIVTRNLAAKYRPRILDDYIGQDHLVKTVEGWLKTGSWPATIMLTGMTGCGKTTLARLLARYINCDTHSACGECPSCQYMSEHPDIKEINMGELGKVDDVRSMIKTFNFAPRFNKRIFIFDESHLMTKQAASALLVPVEEPPKNTIFIFCTTDPEKMLPTIKNRATELTIRPVEPQVLVKRMKQVCSKEKVKITDRKAAGEALELLAEFSGGMVRESLSRLEALLAAVNAGEPFSKKTVLDDFVNSSESRVEESAVQILCTILKKDIEYCIKFLRREQNARGIVSKMRWLIHWIIGDVIGTNKFTPYIAKLFTTSAKKQKLEFSLPLLINLQSVLVKCENQFNTSSIPEEVVLETELAKVIISDYFWEEKD